MAAPLGNKNGAKTQKPWRAAIDRALAKRTLATKREALDDLAEKLLEQCEAGDLVALKELADRLDGRSVALVANDDDGAFRIEVTQRIVDAGSDANA